METYQARIEFTDSDINAITAAINPRAIANRLSHLAAILHDWANHELQDHLSRETMTDKMAREKRLNDVCKLAERLEGACGALETLDRDLIEYRLNSNEYRLNSNFMRDFVDNLGLLKKGADAAIEKRGKGAPPKLVHHLVTTDLAAIYRYITRREAARDAKVGDADAEATGTFWDFCVTVWPIVFGSADDGLQYALRKLEQERSAGRGASALVANCNFRHPEWQLIKRKSDVLPTNAKAG